MEIAFVTGNPKKAAFFAEMSGISVIHHAMHLEEIQSMNLHEIVEHKVRAAFDAIHHPVLVEDVSLECHALGRLPGPFIKFFLEELSSDGVCKLLRDRDRSATARCVYGFFDGSNTTLFEGSLTGIIADAPSGSEGYGWDNIFIPEGYSMTRATLSEEEYSSTYIRLKPYAAIARFLQSNIG